MIVPCLTDYERECERWHAQSMLIQDSLRCFSAITSSSKLAASTRLPNRSHSKNDPLSLRLRLYVSSGGGERRYLSIIGI